MNIINKIDKYLNEENDNVGYAIKLKNGKLAKSLQSDSTVWWPTKKRAEAALKSWGYDDASVIEVELERDKYGYNGYKVKEK